MAETSFYYTVIARKNNVILCDWTDHLGDVQKLTFEVMKQVQSETSKTLEVDDHHFHYVNQNGLLTLVMTVKTVQ